MGRETSDRGPYVDNQNGLDENNAVLFARTGTADEAGNFVGQDVKIVQASFGSDAIKKGSGMIFKKPKYKFTMKY